MYGIPGKFLVDVKVGGTSYPLGEGRLAHLRIHEWSSVMSPIAEIALNDRMNFLMEIMGLTGTETFEIGIGDREDNILYTPYRLFKATSNRQGSDSHAIKLLLVAEKALPLYRGARYESYPGASVAEVVDSIAGELNLEVELENTQGAADFFCPGWTYAQFLRWLAARATSTTHGTTGFIYFVDMENKLHFYSPEYAKVKGAAVDVVRMDLGDIDSYAEKDVDLGPYRVYQNPMRLGVDGGWGITSAYFDFEANKFVEAPVTVNGSQGVTRAFPDSGYTSFERKATAATRLKGLADNLSILESDLDGLTRISDGGVASVVGESDLRTASSEATLLESVVDMNKQDLLLVGNLNVRAGGLIAQQVGSPLPDNAINQVLSGKWLVERVTHQLMPDYVTKVMVYRAGISGSDKAGLLTPPGGVVR